MSYPTPAATPPVSLEQRRQRRAAAGRSGGEFELIRQGDLFTFRYASPDPRRHEAGGQYSWERTSSIDGFQDVDTSTTHSQTQAESTPITSPLASARENNSSSSLETSNAIRVEDTDQTPLLGTFRRQASAESMYSRDSSGEEILRTCNSYAVSHDPSEEVTNGATKSTGRVTRQYSMASDGITEFGDQVESMVGDMWSRSPVKKKSFVSIKSMKPFIKKIMQKPNGSKAVRKMIRLFKPTFHRMGLVVQGNNDDVVVDDRNELRSRRQEFACNPSTPKKQMIGSKSDSPVKEQLLRENDHDLPHPSLEKEFFTPLADRKRSNKEPLQPPDADADAFD